MSPVHVTSPSSGSRRALAAFAVVSGLGCSAAEPSHGSTASGGSTSASQSGPTGTAVSSSASGASGTNGSDALPPMSTQSFLIGYDEAWFGGAFATDYTSQFDLAYVRKVFDGISAGGGHLVRLWLFPAPQGFALAANAPRSQPISQEMLTHVDVVLTEARKRGLWVYLTLLDGNTLVKAPDPIHTWGSNLLNGVGGESDAFNANVLAPLLAVVDGHRDVMFGMDIINEIQAAIQKGLYADPWNGPRSFLQAEAAFIHSKTPWLKVTSSAGWPVDLLQKGAQYDIANGLYSGLGLDFYDLHAYADSGSFVGATAMCQRAAADGVPVYLGEFGQGSKATDDAIQSNATAAFLNNAKALCFKGAFAWRFDPAEGHFSFVRPDFSPRPAVTIMQTFGAQP